MRLALFFSLLLAATASLRSAESRPPNILLVLTDDQGFGDFSLNGNTVLATPTVDRFAREGIRFDRFYVSPVCAPTRAALLTGRWPERGGVWGVTQRREVMRAEEVTIAERLRAAGYRTGIFGKWHNGEQFPLTPLGQGFDEFLGFTAGHWNNYFDPVLLRGSQPEQTKGYITDILTDAAIEFMARNRDRPFLCYVPYNAPHSPFQTPDRYFDRFKAKALGDDLAAIYAMCAHIDDSFARLLDAVDRLGLRENTLVLFLTDNGPTHVVRFNAGMRGTKASVHEGGSRVPLLVRYPARFKESRTVSQIAAHVDVLPTLLELCGVRAAASDPKLDGSSLVPLLEGREENWPERLLFTHQSGGAKPQPWAGAVRSQRYRAVLEGGAQAAWQLYDMIADPGEQNDLAKTQPDLARQFAGAYEAWWREVSRAGFGPEPIPVGYAEQDPVRLFAPQAVFSGKVRFFVPQGYANTWLTGWSEAADRIAFPLRVARGGEFQVTLIYGCASENAGATVRVASRGGAAEAVVPAAPAPRIRRQLRGAPSDNYVDRAWGRMVVGNVTLETGQETLTLSAVRIAGAEVVDLKEVELRRVK